MKTTHLFFGVLFVLVFQAGLAQNQIKLETGAKYETKSEMKTKSSMDYMGQKIETDLEQDTHVESTVKGMTDGLYELVVETKAIQTTVKQMGQEMKFDSNNADDLKNPIWAGMEDVLKSKVTMKLDNKGEVKETKGEFDMQNMGGGDNNGMFLVLPESLSIGKSWTTSSDEDGQKRDVTYTVKEITGNKVILNAKGNIDMTQTIDAGGVEGESKSTGTFVGELTVDKSSFLIMESSQLINLNVAVDVMGEKVPATSTTNIKVVTKKL